MELRLRQIPRMIESLLTHLTPLRRKKSPLIAPAPVLLHKLLIELRLRQIPRLIESLLTHLSLFPLTAPLLTLPQQFMRELRQITLNQLKIYLQRIQKTQTLLRSTQAHNFATHRQLRGRLGHTHPVNHHWQVLLIVLVSQ